MQELEHKWRSAQQELAASQSKPPPPTDYVAAWAVRTQLALATSSSWCSTCCGVCCLSVCVCVQHGVAAYIYLDTKVDAGLELRGDVVRVPKSDGHPRIVQADRPLQCLPSTCTLLLLLLLLRFPPIGLTGACVCVDSVQRAGRLL